MCHYGFTLVTAPASEPVVFEDVAQALRVEEPDELFLLQRYITSARMQVEADTQRKLITQTWDIAIDGWPYGSSFLTLPIAPLQSVTSVTAIDADGVSTTWAASNYGVDTYSVPGRIYLKPNQSWPTDARHPVAAVIRVVAGYGSLVSDVPVGLTQAIESLVAHRYEHREPVIVGDTAMQVPLGYESMVSPYWVGMLP